MKPLKDMDLPDKETASDDAEFDYVETAKFTRSMAEQGDAEAQFWYARCLSEGWGVKIDEEESIKWMRKAAEQGLAEAQCSLARYFLDEESDSGNQKAIKLLKKAVKQDYDEAQTLLGVCYLQGTGLKKDVKKGIKLLLKAAEQGNDKAQELLDELLHDYDE